MTVTVKSALRRAREQFKGYGMESPALDAEVLLSHVTGLNRAGLYREWERRLSEEEAARFFTLVERRTFGEPVAYLTGHKEFMGLDFVVNPHVLIPRPETELLVETALRLLPPAPFIIEVGTGSGAITVSLACLIPDAVVYATDLSAEALAVARVNAAKYGVAGRVSFYHGDLMEPLADCIPAGGADLIAANLPYIAREDLPGLPREVRLFEPTLALDGGTGGLALYRRLLPAAAGFLRQGGFLLMEIGYNQGRELTALLKKDQSPVGNFWEVTILKDLSGLDRLVVAKLVE